MTTVLLVRTAFLKDHANLVDDLLQGQIQANDYIQSSPADAEKVVGDWLTSYSQSTIPQPVLDSAWSHLTFSNDPLSSALIDSAKHAESVDLLDPVDNLSSIFDLDPVNKLLTAASEHTVSGP